MIAPTRIWIVVFSNGETHYLKREPLEGIVAWAAGTDATVIEYVFKGIIHKPKEKTT